MRGRRAPVALAEDPADDPAGSVDEHRVRMAPHAERGRPLTGAIDPERELNSEIFSKLLHRLRLLLQVDAHDLEAVRFEPLVERRLGGSLPPAIRSPCGKEAEENRATAELPETDFAAIQGREGDVRGRLGRN